MAKATIPNTKALLHQINSITPTPVQFVASIQSSRF